MLFVLLAFGAGLEGLLFSPSINALLAFRLNKKMLTDRSNRLPSARKAFSMQTVPASNPSGSHYEPDLKSRAKSVSSLEHDVS